MWDRDLEAGRPGAGKGAGQGKNPKANCLLHTFALGHFFFQELLSHLLFISHSRPAIHAGNPINLIIVPGR